MTPDELAARLLASTVVCGKIVDDLPDTRLGRHVAGQLVRCCTSPFPNYEEACAAESRSDFVHKTSVSLKELRETRGWLRFILAAELLPPARVHPALQEADELCRIVGASVVTAKKNTNKWAIHPERG
jgi:four helix bundle protein